MITLPSLDQEARKALRESIDSFGVVVPVVYNRGELIDGHNRVEIAGELGIDVPSIDLDLDGDQAEQLAVELNTARRQMSLEVRRSIVKSLIEAGYSQRAVAKAVGVGKTTVIKDIKSGGHPRPPEKSLGLDGKQYPTTKRKGQQFRRDENGELSERQQQLSGGVKKRLDKLAGTCDALAEAPEHLNLHYALETASAQEIAGWTASVKAGIAGLRTILKTLEA